MSRPVDAEARRAAERTEARSVLVEAGAGTGKTQLLVDRICRLVEQGTPLDRIVAITFTEKAAGELRARIRDEVTRRAEAGRSRMTEARAAVDRAPISTIHAFAASLLRRYAVEAGVDPAFEVTDEPTHEEIVDRSWDAWLAGALERDARPWLEVVEAARQGDPAHLARLAREIAFAPEPLALPSETGGPVRDLAEWLLGFRDAVAASMRARGALGFDTLLTRTRDLLRDRAAVRRRLAAHYPYLCIDEYQDTDPVQTEIMRLLGDAGTKVFLVGDPKQSIYGFRGADVEAFVEERTRVGAAGEIHEIRQSFRASGRVVRALNAIFEVVLPPAAERWEIPHAPLVAARGEGGGPPALAVVR